MSRHPAPAFIRSFCFFALLMSLALSGLSVAAASPDVRQPGLPTTFCMPGKCPVAPPITPLCGDACLKAPPLDDGLSGKSPAGVTNFHAGLDMEWTDEALDSPCTDPNHINCVPNVPVFHLSFDSSKASSPVVVLGIGYPSNGGYFSSTAPTTILPVAVGAAVSHAWTLYPAQEQFQLFSDWTDHWPPGTRDLWNQGWAVVMAYDPNNRNALPQDFPIS
jgi:hypothetical protein